MSQYLSLLINFWFSELNYNSLGGNFSNITIQNIMVTDNYFNGGSLLAVYFQDPILVSCLEKMRFILSNLTFNNNLMDTFAMIIDTSGVLTSITDMIVENNTFQNSYFIHTTSFDSVFISNSSVVNLMLQIASYFVSSNYTPTSTAFYLEYGYYNSSSGTGYAPVVPFIIYNTTFNDIVLQSSSMLLVSNNPNIIIQGCVFTQVTAEDSIFINLGNSYNYYSGVTSFYFPALDTEVPIKITSISIFTSAEEQIFTDLTSLSDLYQSTRNYLSQSDPLDDIYFISLVENSFDSMNVTGDSSALILLQDFQLPNSSINISSNSFSNINADESYDLISATNIDRFYLVSNQITNSSSQGYVFSFISSTINYVVLKLTTMSSTQQLSLYNLEATECNQISMINNQAINIESEQTFINVGCKLMPNDFIFQESVFENIAVQASEKSINVLRFIALDFSQVSTQINTYTFEANTFSNITLQNFQGYATGRFQSTFFFASSLNSSILLLNNTFDTISVYPKGSIMELFIPYITLMNSTFIQFTFDAAKSAFNLFFKNLTLC